MTTMTEARTEARPATNEVSDRGDARAFQAAGHTSEGFRQYADSPRVVAWLAEGSGETEETVRALLLSLAGRLAALPAGGTPGV